MPETDCGFPVVPIKENKREKENIRHAGNFPAPIWTAASRAHRNASKENLNSTSPRFQRGSGFEHASFPCFACTLGSLFPKSPQWKIVPRGSLGREREVKGGIRLTHLSVEELLVAVAVSLLGGGIIYVLIWAVQRREARERRMIERREAMRNAPGYETKD